MFWDTGYWPTLVRDCIRIFVIVIEGFCISRNFGIRDIENYFFWVLQISNLGYGILL